MGVLFYGLGLLFFAFFIHLALWRIHLPNNHTKALIIIFFVTLVVGLFVFLKFPDITILGMPIPKTTLDYLQLSFMFASLALFYIVTYVAIEVDSPSLVIVLSIAKTGEDGLDNDSLTGALKDDYLVINRIKDLLVGGFVSLDNQVYSLKLKGRLMAFIFIVYRRLLGVDKGG